MDAVKTLENDTKKFELKGIKLGYVFKIMSNIFADPLLIVGPVTAFRWRSELGRPSKITKISDTDLLSGDSSNIGL